MAELQQETNAKDNEEKQIQPGGSKCFKCHEILTADKNSKLLHCLHTFCDACLQTFSKQNKSNAGAEKRSSSACGQEETNGNVAQQPEPEVSSSSTLDDKLSCPECGVVYMEKDIMPNPFMLSPKKNDSNMQDGSPSTEKYPVCTSCDDNQRASSFCMDCAEWLCDPCVIAHKRVKLTKDHTISADVKPDEVKEGVVGDNKHRQIFCQSHKTETLKLFCLTCETLTCRDCQLNEHKDHKYQYIEQTIEQQKRALMEGVNELKKRLVMNQEMSQKIIDKESNISKQQVDVFYEVRQVADVVTNELISWCKKLLNFLQGVCHGRIKDLTFKKNEVATFDKKAKNTIEFVESALESGDDLSVLLAKSFMAKSINSLKDQTINFPNTLLEFNIKYENDAKFLSKHVSKMGFINMNGKSYPQNPNQVQPPTAPAPPTSTLNQSKETIIAELIKKQPLHVQEKYRTLPVEQKRMFVNHLIQYSERVKNKQPNQNTNQPAPNMTVNQRPPHYSTDSTAIQDWYSNRTQRPTLERQIPYQTQQQQQLQQQQQQQQLQQQRQQQQQLQRQQLQQQQQHMIRPATFQQQQFRHGGVPMGQWPGNQIQNPQMPPLRSQPPSLITADKLPSGRFDIDPLNLRGGSIDPVRVKQEPRDRDFSSCQFSDHQPVSSAVSVTNPRIQSPSTSTTGIHQSPGHTPSHTPSDTPGHTPSPSHSDGGGGGGTTKQNPGQSTTTTPAMPDINVMDTDRNELLLRLIHPSGQKINAYHLHPKHDPNDPSEDYCGVCHNGGDLLCCDRCPKVFHLQCHVPFINSNLSSSDQWTCTMCIPDAELIIASPLPREVETGSGKRKALDGLLDKEIKVCERILLELFCLEISTVFHEPVPKSVPNYHKMIQSPMDLSTVKAKLRRGHFTHYNTVNDMIVDVNLIFKNCFKFNQPTSDVFAVGKSVKNFFESLVKHFLPCYIEFMVQDMNTPLQAVDGNGVDGPSRNKKRKSPAPDSTRENSSPIHFH